MTVMRIKLVSTHQALWTTSGTYCSKWSINVSSFYHVFFLKIIPWFFESMAVILKSPLPCFSTPRGTSGEWWSCKEDSSVLTCWLICNWLLTQHSEACCFLPSWRRFSLKGKPVLRDAGAGRTAAQSFWLALTLCAGRRWFSLQLPVVVLCVPPASFDQCCCKTWADQRALRYNQVDLFNLAHLSPHLGPV